MAIRVTCDGCGVEIPPDTPGVGFVRQAQYCDTCRADYDVFHVERDKLHEHVAKVWRDGHAVPVDAWRTKHPNGALPDGIGE